MANTIQHLINTKTELNEAQQASLVKLLTKRCRANTVSNIERIVTMPIKDWNVFPLRITDRIHFVGDYARYIAGQEYTLEISAVRNDILKMYP